MSQQLVQPDGAFSYTREYAVAQDTADALAPFKREFRIPTKADLRSRTLPRASPSASSTRPSEAQDPSIYLCGNSLGLQPHRTSTRINQYLSTWSTQGVFAHFKPLEDSPLPTWLDADDEAARRIALIVGAGASEVAVMQTLTANLHFLMSWLYRPEKGGRHKIIIESKAFPSDHYAVESQIESHGLNPSTSMITISPSSSNSPLLTTADILSTITEHHATTALIILPGIQFYTGQLLDVATITAHAHSHGIRILWDLAHAVGNVPLHLHGWQVDAAAWCSYKYLNAGPGSIGGLFVHSDFAPGQFRADEAAPSMGTKYTGKLTGWWGSSKASRFQMNNHFEAASGAGAFQLSNPSIYDITSLCASLEVFEEAGGIAVLREKSVRLTAYLETMLCSLKDSHPLFEIITSSVGEERGAQLSLKLEEGLLDVVMEGLVERGVVVDERRPDVIRVAPAPLYNGWVDVWEFCEAFKAALIEAVKAREKGVAGEGTDELLKTT